MIQKLGPQHGAWNEDTVRIIGKVNEIVDLLNGKNEKKTTLDPKEAKERGKGKANTKVNTTDQLQDKAKAKPKARVTTTVGTLTPKKEKDHTTRGG
jgi:hypothetical protein